MFQLAVTDLGPLWNPTEMSAHRECLDILARVCPGGVLSQLAGPHQLQTNAPACGWSVGPTAKIREKPKKKHSKADPILVFKFWAPKWEPGKKK